MFGLTLRQRLVPWDMTLCKSTCDLINHFPHPIYPVEYPEERFRHSYQKAKKKVMSAPMKFDDR